MRDTDLSPDSDNPEWAGLAWSSLAEGGHLTQPEGKGGLPGGGDAVGNNRESVPPRTNRSIRRERNQIMSLMRLQSEQASWRRRLVRGNKGLSS